MLNDGIAVEGWGTNGTVWERRRLLASEGTCWEKNLNIRERTGLLAIEGDFWGANSLAANEVERWTTKKNAKDATDCSDTNRTVGEQS